jgi:hypothetical protein
MDIERRRWLERIAETARRSRDDLVRLEDAHRLRSLIRSLEDLEKRVRDELSEGDRVG